MIDMLLFYLLILRLNITINDEMQSFLKYTLYTVDLKVSWVRKSFWFLYASE